LLLHSHADVSKTAGGRIRDSNSGEERLICVEEDGDKPALQLLVSSAVASQTATILKTQTQWFPVSLFSFAHFSLLAIMPIFDDTFLPNGCQFYKIPT